MTRLIPARYLCREHHRDLTEEVYRKVDFLVPESNLLPWPHANPRRTRAFEVDVHCPEGTTGGHDLRFMGTCEP